MNQTVDSVVLRAIEDRDEIRKVVLEVGHILHALLLDNTLPEEHRERVEEALSRLAQQVPRLRRLGAPKVEGKNRWAV